MKRLIKNTLVTLVTLSVCTAGYICMEYSNKKKQKHTKTAEN